MMLRTTLLASLAGLSQAGRHEARDDEPAPLKLNDDGSFQIAVFSDLHFGQDESTIGPKQDLKSIKVISDILDFDPPDLVVLNGDLINGESTRSENSTEYVDQVVGPMVNRKLPWASTYGNHDYQRHINGERILEREYMSPGARTRKMVDGANAGTSNYYLPVYAADCTDDDCAPELLLWFFDSRGGFDSQGKAQPNWVDSSVVSWFNQTNTNLTTQHEKVIPALAFVHIPINATVLLQHASDVHPNYQPGLTQDPSGGQQSAGWCADGTQPCTYGGQDLGFMQALVGNPGIMGLFYGHNHGNTWCYKWESLLEGMTVKGNGINLCYGQHSGYGGYGDWIRGARQIVVSRERLRGFSVDSHIRLESGDVVGAVSLNATFNQDFYPATPNLMTYTTSGASAVGKGEVYLPCRSWILPEGWCFGLGRSYLVIAYWGLWVVVECVFWML